MRRNTILIISILAMLSLAGSLMAFTIDIYTYTNRTGTATVEITEYYSGNEWDTVGPYTIVTNSNNYQESADLPSQYYYKATLTAYNGYAYVTQVRYFNTASITFNVDLSGTIPDDPPAGN